MYADDSTLGPTGKTVEDLENKLNPDIEKVDDGVKVTEWVQIVTKPKLYS